jgi:2-polyprenyl-6-methoxyphenol hydroxylase-like FAD-dependent oxidoreductase
MPERKHDIIVVGGGLAGAAFARAMAQKGASVLVLERETGFKDRIRGETMGPWGVAELRTLGLYELMRVTCGREVRWFDTYFAGALIAHRDLAVTAALGLPPMNWIHHEMEEVLLCAAADAGAEVRRGVHVRGVQPGEAPSALIEDASGTRELKARLVVAADGRSSNVRKWGDFEVHRDEYGLLVAGVLLEMPQVDAEVVCYAFNPGNGSAVFIAPQRDGLVRAYTGVERHSSTRYQGMADLPQFIKDSVEAGAPAHWYSGIRHAGGPLATFDGADTWVEHPYKNRIVLIGDAASSNDPSYGQGQALALRDARVLSDHLGASDDWDSAAHAYAADHDRYYGARHRFTGWFYQLFLQPGAEADARRARALPLLGEDPTRMPDVMISGPDRPMDEEVRGRMFGEM